MKVIPECSEFSLLFIIFLFFFLTRARTVCMIFCDIFTWEVFLNWPRTHRLQEGPVKHPNVFAEASILDDPTECEKDFF